jgi:hypothetical protein
LRPKNSSSGRPFTVIVPLPGFRKTRAEDDLRLPVAMFGLVGMCVLSSDL